MPGYDLIVHIGKLRFFHLKQIEEIRSELLKKGIDFPKSSISRYIDLFLAMVECLHFTKLRKLRRIIKENGGYLLHIDCTTEVKSDTVFVCFDKVTGMVLLSEKVPSEKRDYIKTQLMRLKKYLGDPIAIMRDMSDSLGAAAQEVFKKAIDRICQFHLLKDIGKDLLKDFNIELGKRISKLKINAELNRLRRELESSISSDMMEAGVCLLENKSFDISKLWHNEIIHT